MSDPLIRACDNYVVLEPGKKEQLLTTQETLIWLQKWLKRLERLPVDLQNHSSLEDVAQRLIDTYCILEIEPGFKIQWYAIRVDNPKN